LGKEMTAVNHAVTEGAANTKEASKIEIPGSSGAKKVYLVRYVMDVDSPDTVAATLTKVSAALYNGDKETATSAQLNATDVIDKCEEIKYAEAGPVLSILQGVNPVRGRCMVPVIKDGAGKYYLTLLVLGNANSNAKTARLRAECMIVR